jgi:hypothetical protein
VKLHHMGEERLVEVDDRMPCTVKGRLLLPHASNQFELWPTLLSKAIIKLFSYKWLHGSKGDCEVGDPTIVHALTGLLSQRIDMSNFMSEKWATLRRLLNDEHYYQQRAHISAYCHADYKPMLPSLAKQSGAEDRLDVTYGGGSRTLQRFKRMVNLALSVTSGRKVHDARKLRPAYVVRGFGYSLVNTFENDEFNMRYALQEDRDSVPTLTNRLSF